MSKILQIGKVNLEGFGLEWVDHIGNGHFGVVQLVREVKDNKLLVAKTVSLSSLNEKELQNAHQEVCLLQALRHPLIVSYCNSFLIDGMKTLVILMEHCMGGDLRERILQKAKAGQTFAEDLIMTWFAQILLALQYIHSEKVLHRDLKTSNVFLAEASEASTVKLGDFGISRVMEGTSDVAASTVGTPYYMSPEVCRNEPYNWKSDVWALGCVLFELCALKRAFESSSLAGLIYRIVYDQHEAIPQNYSQAMRELVAKLLLKSADDRPSVDDLLEHPYAKGYLQRQAMYAISPPIVPNVHDPQVRLFILADRVQTALAAKNLNVSAFAPSVDAPGGMISKGALQNAIVSLSLGLSHVEAQIFVESLIAGDANRISLTNVESTLLAAPRDAAVSQLKMWTKNVLEPFQGTLASRLQTCDSRRSGYLSDVHFRGTLLEMLPDLTQDQLDILKLLAFKNAAGEVSHDRFVEKFCRQPDRLPDRAPSDRLPPLPDDLAVMSDWGTAQFETGEFGDSDTWGTAVF